MKKEQGFSLIELLIVVAIIAIIAAIAVPSMLTARMAANEAGAIQGCRTVGSAQVAHAAVNNQMYATMENLVSRGFVDARFSEGFSGYDYDDATTLDFTGFDATEMDPPSTDVAAGGFGVMAAPQSSSTGRFSYGIAPDQVVRYQGETLPDGITSGDPIGKTPATTTP